MARRNKDSGAQSPSKQLHVLVVEDDDDSRDLLVALLRRLDCVVFPAASAEEALSLASEHHLNLAFVDFVLPDANGDELGAHLRRLQAKSHIRLVAISGYSSAAASQLAASQGFDEFLPKPLNRERIAAIVREASARPARTG